MAKYINIPNVFPISLRRSVTPPNQSDDFGKGLFPESESREELEGDYDD